MSSTRNSYQPFAALIGRFRLTPHVVVGGRILAFVAAVLWSAGSSAEENGRDLQYRQPSFLSEYDFATRSDLRLSYHLKPLVSGGNAENWSLLADLEDQVGDWVTQFLSPSRIAETITQTMPTEGQPALQPINDLVRECCQILQVDSPDVFVRQHWLPQAYVTQVGGGRNFLVLTSGLLDLYEGSPEELRFVIGHELGHLKCGHFQTRRAAHGLHIAIQSVNLTVVPDKYQAALPTLALGRLFSWSRESEISADRAGLLCCQDPQVAYNALLRLLSGIGAGSAWIDPKTPDFKPDEVIQRFREWEYEPFVDLVMYLKRQTAEAPFIPERVAAIKAWAESSAYQSILNRETDAASDVDQIVVIKTITLHEICEEGATADPYVIAYAGEQKLFETKVASGMRSVRWRDIDNSFPCHDGQPLFFEVWDSNYGSDELIGGFDVLPVNPQHGAEEGSTRYTTSLRWDWKRRSSQTRNGLAEIDVEYRQRAK